MRNGRRMDVMIVLRCRCLDDIMLVSGMLSVVEI